MDFVFLLLGLFSLPHAYYAYYAYAAYAWPPLAGGGEENGAAAAGGVAWCESAGGDAATLNGIMFC
jgi:hypothetical protein